MDGKRIFMTMCLKKCSFRKICFTLVTAFFVYSSLLSLKKLELVHHLRSTMTNGSLVFPENVKQNLYAKDEWPSNNHVYLYSNMIEDNPLATYFSGRLRGSMLSGTSHLDFYKKDHPNTLKMFLVFVEDTKSPSVQNFQRFCGQQRRECIFADVNKELPPLVLEDIMMPIYSLVVFDEYISYKKMDVSRRGELDNYCRRYNIGILAQTNSTRSSQTEQISDVKITLQRRMRLETFKLNPRSNIWRVAKPEQVYLEPLPSSDWTVFITSHETYEPLAFSTVSKEWQGAKTGVNMSEFGCVIALRDKGLIDGIQRVILGYDLEFWLNSVIALDAVTLLSQGRLSLPLTRLLQVDVDDMFVGASGIRTQVKDAQAMAESQERIQKLLPNFTYKLGFSGSYFKKGNEAEQAGDMKIVELADHFVWFNHMYRHENIYTINYTRLKLSLNDNINFAKEHRLNVINDYMVTPYHSGVYPVSEDLYSEWNKRGVACTSTMLYPSLHPMWARRGFIYHNIMVLPRQSCNLYTKTNWFKDYTGGKPAMDANIQGGFLFKTFLYTPVLVFMTHMSNYANDQLAQYTFENVIQFVTKWTNLQILTPPPLEIARRYFQMYPDEATPMWTNPCDSYTKKQLLPHGFSCSKFPKFIIVGPQKSGSTALQKFLEAHPMLVSTKQDPVHFEEVQFFCHVNYLKGLDWYQSHFPEAASQDSMLFEKTANYFHCEVAPRRVQALLPSVKIIIILTEPVRRTYSWYQHMRSNGDLVARNYTFFQIISAPETAPRFLKDARNRYLQPGAYAIHLARWLQFFPRHQIYLVDGDRLQTNPVTVLNQLQKFLNVTPSIDYRTKLRFDPGKGFYCRTDTGCLGPSKGRNYPPIDPESRHYLEKYFLEHNANLKLILRDIDEELPQWLKDTSMA